MHRKQRIETLQSTVQGRSFVAPSLKAATASKASAAAGLRALSGAELGLSNEEDTAEHDAYRVFDDESQPSRLRVDLSSGDNTTTTNLVTAHIPATATYIADHIFADCNALDEATREAVRGVNPRALERSRRAAW